MKTLAYYIYPLPKGTEYTKEDLKNENKVEELFDYCQILEGVITKEGWNYLIEEYGYEKLFYINNKSGWFDCDTLEEYICMIENNI